MIVYLSLLVAVVGAFLFVLVAGPISTLGLVAFGAGLLAFLLNRVGFALKA